MDNNQPQGCLAAILQLFGITLGQPEVEEVLPYRLRDDFLSPAEYSFYRVLASAVNGKAIVCPKVNLADIFFVIRPNENQGFRNKIDRKHVDFLLCDPVTMQPRCGVELDDSSHDRPDRQERDEFVDSVFEVAGLPLVRVPAQSAYNHARLLSQLEPHLNGTVVSKSVTSNVQHSGTPICPKCGVPMIERVAKRGQNAGNSFFGCPNYPKCKETA